jgi:hypothetical protein
VTSGHKTLVAPPLAHTIAFRSRSSNEEKEGIRKFFSKWDYFFFWVLIDSPNFLFCNFKLLDLLGFGKATTTPTLRTRLGLLFM